MGVNDEAHQTGTVSRMLPLGAVNVNEWLNPHGFDGESRVCGKLLPRILLQEDKFPHKDIFIS
jgi:hypothetical protein